MLLSTFVLVQNFEQDFGPNIKIAISSPSNPNDLIVMHLARGLCLALVTIGGTFIREACADKATFVTDAQSHEGRSSAIALDGQAVVTNEIEDHKRIHQLKKLKRRALVRRSLSEEYDSAWRNAEHLGNQLPQNYYTHSARTVQDQQEKETKLQSSLSHQANQYKEAVVQSRRRRKDDRVLPKLQEADPVYDEAYKATANEQDAYWMVRRLQQSLDGSAS